MLLYSIFKTHIISTGCISKIQQQFCKGQYNKGKVNYPADLYVRLGLSTSILKAEQTASPKEREHALSTVLRLVTQATGGVKPPRMVQSHADIAAWFRVHLSHGRPEGAQLELGCPQVLVLHPCMLAQSSPRPLPPELVLPAEIKSFCCHCREVTESTHTRLYWAQTGVLKQALCTTASPAPFPKCGMYGGL